MFNMCKSIEVKTTINASSLLAKKILSDLVGQRPISIILNFKLVIKPFLVWNIYFTFSLPLVVYSFDKSTIKSNCILFSCHVRVSEWICTL